jgi:hypothetical protein
MAGLCFVISVTYLIMPNTERMMMMKKKIDCSFENEFMWIQGERGGRPTSRGLVINVYVIGVHLSCKIVVLGKLWLFTPFYSSPGWYVVSHLHKILVDFVQITV